MLNLETRTAILRLSAEGHGARFIARAVGVSRDAVRRVQRDGHAEVPMPERARQLDEYLDLVRALNDDCKGNLVRVHEELLARHRIEVPYATLTRFCRDHMIGQAPPKRSGQHHFGPGEEMQHDTSPHRVTVGGREALLQCASLVMCFSRRKFIQCYPRWNRFQARVFLTAALTWFGRSAARCMLDNSGVIVASGTGRNAVMSAEMVAFSKRFGFEFVAHRVGDANRSGRVERPFHHVEHNFYPGRTFADLSDLNAQAVAWCAMDNARFHRHYQGVPDELFAIERQALSPIPAFIPEPTEVHLRQVDVEGYVRLHTNRYSAPEELIGVDIEVHETADRVRLFHRHKLLIEHGKCYHGANQRVTAEQHRRRWARTHPLGPSTEELALRATGPAMGALCDALRARHGGQALRAMRVLRRIWLDYPDDVVEAQVARALQYDLLDLARIESMVIAATRGDFFRLPTDHTETSDG